MRLRMRCCCMLCRKSKGGGVRDGGGGGLSLYPPAWSFRLLPRGGGTGERPRWLRGGELRRVPAGGKNRMAPALLNGERGEISLCVSPLSLVSR